MMTPPAMVLLLCALLLAVPQRSDIGKRPAEVLNPKTIESIVHPSPAAASIEERLDLIFARQQAIFEQIQVLMTLHREVSINAQRLADVDARLAVVEKGMDVDQHDRLQSAEPSRIAVLETKLQTIMIVFGSIGTLLLGAVMVFVKRWASQFHLESIVQSEFRETVTAGMQHTKDANRHMQETIDTATTEK